MFGTIIDKIANIALIIACAVVIGEYGYRQVHKPAKTHALFNPGERIQAAASVASGSDRSLILAVSSTCHFCKESMQTYKQVTAAAHAAGARIVAISSEPTITNRAFLASNGVFVDSVLTTEESGFRVPTVPSMILMRKDGSVIDSWTGLADSSLQQAALRALAK
jgi:thioredoxin-related protein